MGAVVKGDSEGGGGCSDVGTVIRCGDADGPYVCVGEMCYVPAHWEGVGRIPPQGGLKVDGSEDDE